jgi:hypothetical protein
MKVRSETVDDRAPATYLVPPCSAQAAVTINVLARFTEMTFALHQGTVERPGTNRVRLCMSVWAACGERGGTGRA